MDKKAILLVAYGISTTQSEEIFRLFLEKVEKRFSPLPVFIAFTAERKSKFQSKGFSLPLALEAIKEEAKQVAVLPLHLIPGIEYNELCSHLEDFSKTHCIDLKIARPLLQNKEFLSTAADILLAETEDKGPEWATLFMAHGTQKAKEPLADAMYVELAKLLQEKNNRLILACMKGTVVFENALQILKKNNIQYVRLLPLLTLIGRHSTEDMAGNGANSWKSRLEAAGFVCKPEQKALLEYPALVECWLNTLDNLFKL